MTYCTTGLLAFLSPILRQFIACRLLMDHPNIADAALLDSPPMAPGQEKQFWVTPVIERSFFEISSRAIIVQPMLILRKGI